MALNQVEGNYAMQGGAMGGAQLGVGALNRNTPLAVFRARDELAKMLEAWATEIGAERDPLATEFAEKLMAAGWSR